MYPRYHAQRGCIFFKSIEKLSKNNKHIVRRVNNKEFFKMETETIQDKIKVMRTRIQLEKDATKKQELNKGLQKLLYQEEIEAIRKRMEQLG